MIKKINFNQTRCCSSLTLPTRQRGSVILLVVITMVMIALLGASYLQIVRQNRTISSQKTSQNIDIVANAVTAYIATVLKNDIVDVNNKFFTTTEDEYYDYPWTDPSSSFNVTLNDGSPDTAQGGTLDDTWLAASSPDFSGGNPVWPHLTNLNGTYLRLPSASSATGQPTELAINNTSGSNTWRRDTGVQITINGAPSSPIALDNTTTSYDQLGADADNDGALDSKWTWAPLRQIAGVSYVMAVRIVDNSACINLNTATAMTTDGAIGYATGVNIPRGYYPSSIDLTRLTSRINGASSAWVTELTGATSSLLKTRGVTTGTVTPIGLNSIVNFGASTYRTNSSYTDLTGRFGAWFGNSSLYNYTTNRLVKDDEIELRYHNGLNYQTVTSDAESLMPTLVRSSGTATNYANIGGAGTTTLSQFFQGGTSAAVSSRVFKDARHLLTTYSGHNIYQPNFNNTTGGAHSLKYDLTRQDGGADGASQSTRVTNIANRIINGLNIGMPGFDSYLKLASSTTIAQMAAEFALMIQDYCDSDDTPMNLWLDINANSTIDPGETFYGLEIMPFLREVYVQQAYTDTDRDDGTLGPIPNEIPDGLFDTWTFVPQSQAMAIEIGNPFDRPISTALLNNRIRIVVRQGGIDKVTYNFGATAPSIPSRGAVVLISNPVTAQQENGILRDNLAHPTDGLNLGVVDTNFQSTITLAVGTLDFASDQDITLEMRINVGGTTWVTYDRLTLGGFQLPSYVFHKEQNLTQAPPRHAQASLARHCGFNSIALIRYLSNRGKGYANSSSVRTPEPPSNIIAKYRNQNNTNEIDKLGLNAKVLATALSASEATYLDTLQLPIPNRPIYSVAELGWIPMFGFNDGPDGDFPQRFSGLGPTAPTLPNALLTADPRRHFLTIDPADVVVPAVTKIPHMAMVLDQFVTYSPRYDGVDNDNDDSDDTSSTSADNSDAEQFVPGTININTAPLHVLTLAAPLPEASITTTQSLMESIIAYRDQTADRDTVLSGFPAGSLRIAMGIASLGELLTINPNKVASGTAPEKDILAYNEAGAQTANTDLYPTPEDVAAGATQYITQMSAEGKMARYQFLSQAFTTRSDIFTAYVLIQGYSSADFRLGAIETKRFFVVFDRSSLLTGSESVKILGIFEEN